MDIHTNMANRNGNNNHNADSAKIKIIKFMKGTNITTTSEISEKLKISWNTAEKRLLELALENKIGRIKKAGVNLWVKK